MQKEIIFVLLYLIIGYLCVKNYLNFFYFKHEKETETYKIIKIINKVYEDDGISLNHNNELELKKTIYSIYITNQIKSLKGFFPKFIYNIFFSFVYIFLLTTWIFSIPILILFSVLNYLYFIYKKDLTNNLFYVNIKKIMINYHNIVDKQNIIEKGKYLNENI